MGVPGRGAVGATALPNSGKTVGKIRAKQEEKKMVCKISGKSTPLPPLTKEFNILQYCSCCVTSHMCQSVVTGDSHDSLRLLFQYLSLVHL